MDENLVPEFNGTSHDGGATNVPAASAQPAVQGPPKSGRGGRGGARPGAGRKPKKDTRAPADSALPPTPAARITVDYAKAGGSLLDMASIVSGDTRFQDLKPAFGAELGRAWDDFCSAWGIDLVKDPRVAASINLGMVALGMVQAFTQLPAPAQPPKSDDAHAPAPSPPQHPADAKTQLAAA